MKKAFIVVALLVLVVQMSQAQFSIGLRGGLNFSNLPEKSYRLNGDEIRTLSDSYTGFHAGIVSQISFLGLFVMPEVLFVSSGHDLLLRREGEEDEYFVQKFNQIDIPVMVGTKFGPARVGFGPVASILLNSKSTLPDDAPYKERFNAATYGFQVGAGVNLGKMIIDLKYQFNLSALGDGIEIRGATYPFDARPRQLLLSIGLMIF
jgi:hypothetical protein